MVQLYVYEGNTRYELDLYETDPIKINLQIEDVIEIDKVESAYTQTFRIPATQDNSRFFKWWYEMSTVDFDITQVVRGEIHSDGLIYMSGEIRLQGAYVNEDTQQVDLEILFLGNTRDFATQIAEIYMNQLPLSSLNHPLTIYDEEEIVKGTIEQSWDGTLHDGAIRYILADRGYDFEENGDMVATQNEMVSASHHQRSFFQQGHPISRVQFTPLIRIKEIVDAIFSLTEYNYTDDSFFSDTSTYWTGLVEDLYTEGLPDESSTIKFLNGNVNVASGNEGAASGVEARFRYPDEVDDINDVWSQKRDEYTAQADGTINLSVYAQIGWDGQSPSIPSDLVWRLYHNGVVIDTDTDPATSPSNTASYTYNNATFNVQAGDVIYLTYEIERAEYVAQLDGSFIVSGAINQVVVPQLLKNDVLILDFFKWILKKFRLVMAPSIIDPLKFVIKPWDDYIGSGDILDWSEKLDLSKDINIKPIFFDQSQDIMFTDTEDSDQNNNFYQDQNNLIFGEFLYDGENELIVGRRDITTGFAPTPVNRVEDTGSTTNFVIPKFYIHGSDYNANTSHDHLQHLPMRPKPRLLFWNGMKTITGSETTWYYGVPGSGQGSYSIPMTTYPRASYATDPANQSTTLHLNWSKVAFGSTINTIGLDGQSVYDRYWYNYITSLYSKDARKYTAYFVLDSQDLRQVSFNDKIFIKGNYYRVAKVYDAPLDGIAPIKVDLIKILN